MKNFSKKSIVIIGGGTGTSTLLEGLKKFPADISVIVSSADDGGSTGKLRKQLGVFPPGDLRQCLVALSFVDQTLKTLFNFRFSAGELKGHTVGNIIIAGLEKVTGNINNAIDVSSKMLNVRGEVLPVTIKPTTLTAILKNGKQLVGEHNIDVPQKRVPIQSIRLSPNGPVNPKVLTALKSADAIVLGPGDLYTSVLPSLLVKGVKESIDKSSAKKILVVNIMTQLGQTDKFKPADFVKAVNYYLGKKKLDAVLVNNKKPGAAALVAYKKQGAGLIAPEAKGLSAAEVIKADLLNNNLHKKTKGDVLHRSLLRHDSDKLAKLIWELIQYEI
jgi:uncharacterized cofD-like protein